jgi:hypothetical protein
MRKYSYFDKKYAVPWHQKSQTGDRGFLAVILRIGITA